MRLLRRSDRTLVFNPESGRHLVLGPDAQPDLERLTERLAPGRYPARSRRTLFLPERQALWHPLPLERSAGGHRFAELPLSSDEVDLWRACDGRTALELPRSFIRKLCALEVQALQLRPSPARAREPALERLCAPERPRNSRDFATLAEYHHAITAEGHFDHVETTVAHCFAVVHPALGEPFGARLRRLLGDGRVLEVGCGTGELARDFGGQDYTRADLSPGLLEAQAEVAPWTRGVLADARSLPFEDDTFDVLICNEVLADLPCTEREGRLVNTGAMDAVLEFARVLRPGGRAWVSEFGDEHRLPEETLQLDHPEVSIQFAEVAAVLRERGLSPSVRPMAEALGVDAHARWMARPCFEALRALWPSLPARAVLEPLPEVVEGLWTVPVTDEGPGPAMARFSVLSW